MTTATAGSAVGLSTLRLGTRRSALAMAQAQQVADLLRDSGLSVELVEVTTEGDRNAAPLAQIGGTGVFVSALRNRLIDGDVDLAVHSLKDLPTLDDLAVVVAAIPTRADPRDALVSADYRTLSDLPEGARVGTGSPRRAAALRAIRSDLDVVAIRGNVDTRIRQVREGRLDAVIVAAAGLERLGRMSEVAELIPVQRMLPAPGQGALAVECRASDSSLAQRLQHRLDDPATRASVTAERALLRALEAGCTAPIGALATIARSADVQTLELTASVTSPDGQRALRMSRTASTAAADEVGRQLAEELLAENAAGLIGEPS